MMVKIIIIQNDICFKIICNIKYNLLWYFFPYLLITFTISTYKEYFLVVINRLEDNLADLRPKNYKAIKILLLLANQ